MPLSFYLLKPVKRVTEYPLLMEKLLKLIIHCLLLPFSGHATLILPCLSSADNPGFDCYLQGMPLSFYRLKPVKRVTEYPLLTEKLLKLIIHCLLLPFSGHATLVLPCETGEASDRVPAARGEVAEAVIS